MRKKDNLSVLQHLVLALDEEKRGQNNQGVITAIEVAIRVLNRENRYALHIELSQPSDK